ncbi:ATP-binding protein [Sagittula sp. SSi028]|uniref:hybrid sensor histidine kinase/response regulator n=1 Tax=Sagittula sp. SSi028 TaxID=3400636 RepID=UPI003AF5B198
MSRLLSSSHTANSGLRRFVIAWVIVSLLGVITVLGLEVRAQLRLLSASATENVQWTLSQAETEVMDLQLAILHARMDPPDNAALSLVRLRFDVLYSRIDTITSSEVIENLRAQPSAQKLVRDTADFRAKWTPVIDGPSTQLQAELDQFYNDATLVRRDLRELALDGVNLFAAQRDLRRRDISEMLLSIGVTGLGLLGLLLLLMLAVLRLASQRAEEAREHRETRERTETIIATSLDAVVAIDSDGRVIEWNGAAERIFGFARAEAIGADMAHLIVPAHFAKQHRSGLERMNITGSGRIIGKGIIQLEARHKDGSLFPVDISLAEAQSARGQIYVAFIRDITSRVQNEQALKQARDRAIAGEKHMAELLAVMSHEMRTPLNGIIGTLDLFQAKGLDAEHQRYLRIIRQSGEVLLSHVNDVLDISRMDAGKITLRKTRFDLVTLLEDLIESQMDFARTQGNTLVLTPPSPDLHNVYSDPGRLRQILLNLVTNALKFTRDGVVTIEADCSAGLEHVDIRVTDTGVGITEDNLRRIFDDFVTVDSSYQRRSAGTGLGLGISQRLAGALGGRLDAESEPGDGSVFWLSLPLAPPPDAVLLPPLPRKTDAEIPPPLDVLVIEDNPINREVASQMLQRDGHVVTTAANGFDGVELAGRQTFDVILMDISMPGMDGITAASRIRGNAGANAATPIVATTAHALPDQIRSFHDAGMHTVLTKPITTTSLRRTLSRALSTGAEALSPPASRDRTLPPMGATVSAVTFAEVQADQLIDVRHLEELAEDLPSERLTEALATFAAEIDTFLNALILPGNTTDATFGAEAHRLAGSAGVFGAMKLATLLGTCQQLVRDADRDGIDALIPQLAGTWDQTRQSFEDLGFTAPPRDLTE